MIKSGEFFISHKSIKIPFIFSQKEAKKFIPLDIGIQIYYNNSMLWRILIHLDSDFRDGYHHTK